MSGFWLPALIGVLGSLVGAVYVFQVLWPRIRSVLGFESEPAESRTRELLRKYRERIDRPVLLTPEESPQIRMIRAAEDEGEVVVLFANEGGTARDLMIETPAGVAAHVEPTTSLMRGESGHLRLSSAVPLPAHLPFAIVYTDSNGRRQTHRYVYRADERSLLDLVDYSQSVRDIKPRRPTK